MILSATGKCHRSPSRRIAICACVLSVPILDSPGSFRWTLLFYLTTQCTERRSWSLRLPAAVAVVRTCRTNPSSVRLCICGFVSRDQSRAVFIALLFATCTIRVSLNFLPFYILFLFVFLREKQCLTQRKEKKKLFLTTTVEPS